jgi:hypothetical protein
VAQAQARGDAECPICMGAMHIHMHMHMAPHTYTPGDEGGGCMAPHMHPPGGEGGCCGGSSAWRNQQEEEGPKPVVLLDCSHVFHAACIEAFEQFNIYEVQLCPICRAAYEKAPF